MLSGVGEAAFVCCVPPWIALNADSKTKSTWIAIFYTANPVGTALGFVYSSTMVTLLHWQWAFFIEAFIMIPLVLCFIPLNARFPFAKPGTSHYNTGNEIASPLLDSSSNTGTLPRIAVTRYILMSKPVLRLHLQCGKK
jgi:MFS family permease